MSGEKKEFAPPPEAGVAPAVALNAASANASRQQQLRAPVGSAVVLAADPGPPVPPVLPPGPPVQGPVWLRSAFVAFRDIFNRSIWLLRWNAVGGVAPHPSPGQQSMKEYQSRVEEGAERVMSHWVGGWGGLLGVGGCLSHG